MAKTPPTFIVTPQDHGGVAVIVSTLLMTWSILCFLIRIYTRQSGSGTFGVDDWLCLAATIVGVIQTIVACVAVEKGFGKAQSLLAPGQLETIEKYIFTVVILSIFAIYITKMSMVFFHTRITPRKDHKKVAYGLLGLIGVIGVVSIIVEATRCDATRPWATTTQQCSDYNAGWTAVAAMDIALELLIFAMPVWILWDVQMSVRNKIVICSAFALRLPVIIAAVVHLREIRSWQTATYPLVELVTPFVVFQVEMHYAAISSTFPCLGPFMKNLNTRMGTMGPEEAGVYALESVNDKSGTHHSTRRGGGGSQHPQDGTLVSVNDTGYSFRVQKSLNGGREAHRSRTRGSDDSGRMIIHKTTDTTVEYEK